MAEIACRFGSDSAFRRRRVTANAYKLFESDSHSLLSEAPE